MLIGHEEVIGNLKKLALSKKLAHGYIFFGPAMVGKKTIALQFANFLETGIFGVPKILGDMLFVEPDEKFSVGIDAARDIKYFLWEKPNVSAYRTVIIDGVEHMTTEAQNALLKIAEEPPVSTLLILITSDLESLNQTISSRLQKIYFSVLSDEAVADWLKKEEGLSPKDASALAGRAFGKPGLAFALFHDKNFQVYLKNAENLLKSSGEKRREVIKKLAAADDFNLAKLIDALIMSISAGDFGKKDNVARWHKFLSLRHEIDYYNLNPRLQLENLLN